jgi:TDG/mug DNA glycosylase family protein
VTIEVYELRAKEWEAARAPRRVDDADAFAARVGTPAAPVVDLGCGPGWYASALGASGAPVICLDAAMAMLELVPRHAPGAARVQADLAALPFRRGGLGGAWASKCYVHLARADVPLALADLHRTLPVGAPIELHVFAGDLEHGPLFEDDFPGRLFSRWPAELLADVVVGAGFTVDGLDRIPARDGVDMLVVRATRARTLADTVGPGLRLLVCGLNPSVYSADAGSGFARPGNRFWPAALAAGLVSVDRDPLHALRHHGMGMTDLVKRATPRADELTASEYEAGIARIERLAAWLRPGAVAFVGLAGWRAAVERGAQPGVQPRQLGGVRVYLMPSTSGANAHAQVDALANHLRSAAALAGGG